MTKPQAEPEGRDAGPPPQGRSLRRRAFGVVLLVVLVAGLGICANFLRLVSQGEPLLAPPWLRDRIEARIEAQTPGLEMDFSELSLVFEESWQPRLRLRDLHLVLPQTRSRLDLQDITGRLALRPLLKGQLEPREIIVDGAQLRLRRKQDGRFDLMPLDRPEGRERGIEDVLAELKQSLATPELKYLRRIEGLGLTLIYDDMRADRSWSVDGGRIVLDRDHDDLVIRGDFSLLGGRSYASLIEASYTTRLDTASGEFALSVQEVPAEDLATQSPALAWLGVLRAPLSGSLRLELEEDGAVGPLHATLQIGQGVLQPAEGARPIPFTSARSYFSFDPATQMLRFSELSLKSPTVSLLADGGFRLGTGPTGAVEMTGQLSASEIVANPSHIFASDLRLDGARADLRLRLDPFELSLGQLSLTENGQTLQTSGWMTAGPKGWSVSLQGGLRDAEGTGAALSPDDVLGFWPPALAHGAREWVARNILEGGLSNLQIGLRADEGAKPSIQMGFDYTGATISFMPTMPPMEGARGHASLVDNRFVVQAEEGQVQVPGGGRVDAAGSSFSILDVGRKPGQAALDLSLRGAIPDTLALLDREPFRFLSKAGKTPDLASGRAALRAEIGFPLEKKIPMDQVDVRYSGRLSDVRSDQLAPGHLLTAGNLDLTGDQSGLRISGAGQFDGIPFTGGWQTALGPDAGPSHVNATLKLNPEVAQALKLDLPPGTLSGEGQVALSLELEKDRPPRFVLQSDLAGLGLSIPSLGWSMSRQDIGSFRASGEMGIPMRIDNLSLQAPGLTAEGALTTRQGGGLDALTLRRLHAGRWLDIAAELRPRGPGKPPAITVSGGTVDLTRMPKLPKGDGGPMSLKLDRLKVSDAITVTGLQAEFLNGSRADFRGLVNGEAPVTGSLDNGRVRVQAADASAALAAGGFLQKGLGGTLDLDLVPTGQPGSYDGTLHIKDIRIQEAPAIAEMLNALSIVGLLEQLSGPGILFSDVEAQFRLTPGALVLTRSSAVGASMGISLDGTYDLAADKLDLQGVFSPLYLLNGIGSVLTRKGEGLIGFNFTVKGTGQDPVVRVNPLSVLTPGMFREIFRRPPPELDQGG